MIISFTNQPGISRGEAKREEFESELKGFGFDKVYLCPHQQNEGCNCRKPSTGMLLQAAEDNNLNLNQCFVIGDRSTDMLAAKDAGCFQVLVKTGAGDEAFSKYQNNKYYGQWAKASPHFVADNFQDAVDWIITNYS